jgi:RNA polymerase sigma factor (sigma-70 family)
MSMTAEDSARLRLLQADDSASWRLTYREQWKRAWATARKILQDPRDIEDAASSALQQLHGQIAKIESMAHLEAMVVVLAQRRAISLLREKRSLKRSDLAHTSLEYLEENAGVPLFAHSHPLLPPTIGSPAEAAQRRLDLEDLLADLAPDDRSLLEAYFVEGKSSREIADETGLNANTLRSRVLRTLQNLRETLSLG